MKKTIIINLLLLFAILPAYAAILPNWIPYSSYIFYDQNNIKADKHYIYFSVKYLLDNSTTGYSNAYYIDHIYHKKLSYLIDKQVVDCDNRQVSSIDAAWFDSQNKSFFNYHWFKKDFRPLQSGNPETGLVDLLCSKNGN